MLALIFILGLTIGSFINALEYRIEEKKSIKGRSFCPNCKHQLAWYDLVPVLSFIFLRGKCRHCGKKISWQYPIVELLGGLSFVAVAVKAWIPAFAGMTMGGAGMTGGGLTTEGMIDVIVRAQSRTLTMAIIALLCLFFIIFCLLLVGLHDQKTSYVLSGYVYAAIVAALVHLLASYTGTWEVKELWAYFMPNVLAALTAMAPFAILYFVSKGAWMGAGDIEIAALLGFLLGWPNFLVALYFAFIVGSVWGLVKIYLLKNAGLKSEIPFAPFLLGGILFAFLFAEQLTPLYVRMFLG